MKNMDKAITIYDIAKVVGVSPATVSRVLSGKAPVKEETARKIREVIKELDYQPNLAARNLQTNESRTLGMILPDISNSFFSEIFIEVERYALTHGYSLFLCNTMNNSYNDMGDVESLYLRSLMARQVDGILFMGGRINDRVNNQAQIEEMNSIAKRIPLILLNGSMKGIDGFVIKTDERDGFLQLLEHVISLGHRDIALIGGTPGIQPSDLKFRAFKDVMKKHDLPINEQWMLTDSFSMDSGEKLITQILSLHKRPSAVLCINDYVAVGALRGAQRAGVKIPQDISICGFDNISMTEHVYPSLTTVSHDFVQLAKTSFDTFLAVRDGNNTPKSIILKMKLIVRESLSYHRI